MRFSSITLAIYDKVMNLSQTVLISWCGTHTECTTENRDLKSNRPQIKWYRILKIGE